MKAYELNLESLVCRFSSTSSFSVKWASFFMAKKWYSLIYMAALLRWYLMICFFLCLRWSETNFASTFHTHGATHTHGHMPFHTHFVSPHLLLSRVHLCLSLSRPQPLPYLINRAIWGWGAAVWTTAAAPQAHAALHAISFRREISYFLRCMCTKLNWLPAQALKHWWAKKGYKWPSSCCRQHWVTM